MRFYTNVHEASCGIDLQDLSQISILRVKSQTLVSEIQ
jgi:hypothetical protein